MCKDCDDIVQRRWNSLEADVGAMLTVSGLEPWLETMAHLLAYSFLATMRLHEFQLACLEGGHHSLQSRRSPGLPTMGELCSHMLVLGMPGASFLHCCCIIDVLSWLGMQALRPMTLRSLSRWDVA